MDKETLLKKAEAALEKNLDILTAQDQPMQVELAIRSIPVILDAINRINLG